MLTQDEVRFAIEDARTRHQSLIELAFAGDQKALSLLSLFVTLASALGTAFAVGLESKNLVVEALTFPSLGAAIVFLIGAFFCLRVLAPADINLPGRTADFWLWASKPNVTFEHACEQYLDNLEKKHHINVKLTERTAKLLNYARLSAIGAPIVAILVATMTQMPAAL